MCVCVCVCACVCLGSEQQQPAVPEVGEPGGRGAVRLQGHRPSHRGGGDGGHTHRQRYRSTIYRVSTVLSVFLLDLSKPLI